MGMCGFGGKGRSSDQSHELCVVSQGYLDGFCQNWCMNVGILNWWWWHLILQWVKIGCTLFIFRLPSVEHSRILTPAGEGLNWCPMQYKGKISLTLGSTCSPSGYCLWIWPRVSLTPGQGWPWPLKIFIQPLAIIMYSHFKKLYYFLHATRRQKNEPVP